MKDILEEIARNKRREIEAAYSNKEKIAALMSLVGKMNRSPLSLSGMIREKNATGMPGIIAEFKRRSPSKGDIAPGADVVPVVKAYEEGGAAGCSVLTDTRFFGGALSDLYVARSNISLPLLRKDFIISEIQIDEAFVAGADVVLLIASLLTKDTIKDFTRYAHERGLEVLLEIHDEREIDKIIPEADMIGVNNRALASFHTDVNHSARLAEKLPKEAVKVAESGIRNVNDVERLMRSGYQGFLIGETLMRATDPKSVFKEFLHVG